MCIYIFIIFTFYIFITRYKDINFVDCSINYIKIITLTLDFKEYKDNILRRII